MLTDEQKSQIYRWWSLFKQGHKLVEIRAISNKRSFSGYYKNIENLIRDVDLHQDCNIYYTVGNLDEAVYGRSQCENMEMGAKTTKDTEVVSRDFVFVDFDCEHSGVSGINSTDEEKHLARLKAVEVYRYLIDNGFNSSIIPVDSCNGYHLYIPCRIKGTPENDAMIKRFTQALSMMFSDENVKIDESVHTRAHLMKLPGTYSRKGSARNAQRPQRMCKILKTPDEIIPNEHEYFQKIANIYPTEPEKPSYSNNFNTSKFDLDEFLAKHNIEVTKIENVAGGKKYILKHCVFDPSHDGRDACIFVSPSGAIGYHCFHSHCQHYSWQDIRLKYEPDAYSRKTVAEFMHKQRYYGNFYREPFIPKPESADLGKKWFSLEEIERVNIAELSSTNTGYPALDRVMWGFFMGDITIITGESGQGKSVWLNNVCANMIERNVNVGIWSGELPAWKIADWMHCTLSGKTYNQKKIGYDNWYYAPSNICDKIDKWAGRRLIIYNNKYGNNFAQLYSDIKDAIDKDNIQIVVVDNLSALNLSEYQGTEFEKQKEFITDMKNLAISKNIHCLIVAHTKKMGSELGRKESVSGNKKITDLADNVIIVSRQGIDFRKRLVGFMGEQKAAEYDNYDTIIEVAKSRMSGAQDKFIGLYYEAESRRIKNERAEHINYGWLEHPKSQPIFTPDTAPSYEMNSPSGTVLPKSFQEDAEPWNDADFCKPLDEDEIPF